MVTADECICVLSVHVWTNWPGCVVQASYVSGLTCPVSMCVVVAFKVSWLYVHFHDHFQVHLIPTCACSHCLIIGTLAHPSKVYNTQVIIDWYAHMHAHTTSIRTTTYHADRRTDRQTRTTTIEHLTLLSNHISSRLTNTTEQNNRTKHKITAGSARHIVQGAHGMTKVYTSLCRWSKCRKCPTCLVATSKTVCLLP